MYCGVARGTESGRRGTLRENPYYYGIISSSRTHYPVGLTRGFVWTEPGTELGLHESN